MSATDAGVDPALQAAIADAAAVLRAGGLVAFPTETVYGLGADARNPAAVRRIFAAKGRPADHPLIVHIADAAQLDAWCAAVPATARQLAAAFWPGPLTLILPRAADVPDAVTGGQPSIGLRVPAHPVALALLRAFGGGIAAPSANRFGHVSPTTAAHVRTELGDAVDRVLDGGPCTVGIESTIVDLTAGHARILRPGGVPRDRIAAALAAAGRDTARHGDFPGRRDPGDGGAPLGHGVAPPEQGVAPHGDGAAGGTVPRVSGALASHYAPRTLLRAVDVADAGPEQAASALLMAAAGAGAVGILALRAPAAAAPVRPDGPRRIEWRMLPGDPEACARALYAQLRALDALDLDLIVVEMPPDSGPWEAVRDRLRKAAGPRATGPDNPPSRRL